MEFLLLHAFEQLIEVEEKYNSEAFKDHADCEQSTVQSMIKN